jgi:cell wall-associated NlpC family hydrolase
MPSLHTLVAQARTLSNEINSLNEQANGLKLQLDQARSEAGVAQHTYQRDLTQLGVGRLAVGQLAAQSYMNGGLDSMLELLTSNNPSSVLSRASVLQELQQQNGEKVSQIQAAVTAAQRARDAGLQQSKRVALLSREIAGKQRQAQSKINMLNSSVFQKAMAVFNQTGQYPLINLPTANTIGTEALRFALSMQGAPYVWGAAGPTKADGFDCSGLMMWAYAQVGISLPHFAADQYNMGIHVSQNNLQPGDLVFFYSDISHVGMYVGNGLMVDAPDFGETVQVQPVMWNVYVGAVRIVG